MVVSGSHQSTAPDTFYHWRIPSVTCISEKVKVGHLNNINKIYYQGSSKCTINCKICKQITNENKSLVAIRLMLAQMEVTKRGTLVLRYPEKSCEKESHRAVIGFRLIVCVRRLHLVITRYAYIYTQYTSCNHFFDGAMVKRPSQCA